MSENRIPGCKLRTDHQAVLEGHETVTQMSVQTQSVCRSTRAG